MEIFFSIHKIDGSRGYSNRSETRPTDMSPKHVNKTSSPREHSS